MTSEARQLLKDFGHRGGVGKTDVVDAYRLRDAFKVLGYRSRVSDVSHDKSARMVNREYRVTWWLA